MTILRERHPFEGRVLQALGAVRRRGVALLLVVLPDGSRSLIPARWTDLAAMPVAEPAAATENGRPHSLARLVDFLHARTILDALLSRVASPRPNPATTEESCRATDSGASRAGLGTDGLWASSLIFVSASTLVPKLLTGVHLEDSWLLLVAVAAALASRMAVLFGLLPLLSALHLIITPAMRTNPSFATPADKSALDAWLRARNECAQTAQTQH